MAEEAAKGVQMAPDLVLVIANITQQREAHIASIEQVLSVGRRIASEIEQQRLAAWQAFFAANPALNPNIAWNLDLKTGLVTPTPAANDTGAGGMAAEVAKIAEEQAIDEDVDKEPPADGA